MEYPDPSRSSSRSSTLSRRSGYQRSNSFDAVGDAITAHFSGYNTINGSVARRSSQPYVQVPAEYHHDNAYQQQQHAYAHNHSGHPSDYGSDYGSDHIHNTSSEYDYGQANQPVREFHGYLKSHSY
ncbi:hypothetical protein CAPTEDRAFT_187948 [Capitella teleta]|uniref:Uncharacterized protein n=1 Tax=Capitella teleta TaxID=283909 RepID=R7UBE3_CAPTE|nr:hypothetical protein CAPTEDRAFT_187948 [Capitella teleta]|eukprot:ELU01123.1 hypothetical protein CAPTEDRAFT_187948 [Capitella teleta]